ncbi:MAG: protein kinase domain-containing protein, partial [Acidimicrobiales bacterium]
YLADDITLRRRVAVKILHDALSGDEAFLRRFRAEAQAAAALNHPHIMSVFDWGHDDVPFLVTEYLGGGSLRTMLDNGRVLSQAQTLMVGLEASRGLDYAHRRGFVHRDIKPANLLFDEEARLRIADFGLARALAEAAWTEPQGAVLGTARYASPEQARGEPLDGRSDVYSLALVLIEAVTGSVPFATDTTIGTLMARVDRPVTVPESLGPLRPALEAAGVPDPAARPDAAEMTRLLMAAAEDLDRPEPLVLAGTMVHDHDAVPDRDPTVLHRPADGEPDIMSAPPGTVIDGIRVIPDGSDLLAAPPGTTTDGIRVIPDKQPVVVFDDADDHAAAGDEPLSRRERRRRKREAQQAVAAGALTGLAPPSPGDDDTGEHPKGDADGRSRRPRRTWTIVVLVLLLLAALGVGGAGYWYREIRIPTYAAPALVGTNVADLDAAVAAAVGGDGDGFTVTQGTVAQDGTVPGQILLQDPAPGVHIPQGGELKILVSTGPPPVPIPTDLVGQTLEAAANDLTAAGLTLGEVTHQWDEQIDKGVVMALGDGVTAGAQVPKSTAIALTVSDGPKPRTVPKDLVGKTQADATAELQAIGLRVAVTQAADDTAPVGQVTASPSAGDSVPRGTAVPITVSSGPPMVTIPSVKGMSLADAAAALQSAGLTVSGTQGSPLGKVQGTNPAAGTVVRRGTTVVIITG